MPGLEDWSNDNSFYPQRPVIDERPGARPKTQTKENTMVQIPLNNESSTHNLDVVIRVAHAVGEETSINAAGGMMPSSASSEALVILHLLWLYEKSSTTMRTGFFFHLIKAFVQQNGPINEGYVRYLIENDLVRAPRSGSAPERWLILDEPKAISENPIVLAKVTEKGKIYLAKILETSLPVQKISWE